MVADYPELGVTVSPVLQRNALPEDREAHIDIADWLLRDMFGPAPFCHSERSPEGGVEESPWRREFLKIADVLSPESHAEVEALIEELGLEVWRVEKVSEGISDEAPP